MAGGREFDRSKFKELVLHLVQASAEDEGFGMVKLNKLLYRADFEAYRLLGKSITGETYEKQDFGPVARELPRALDELAQDQRLNGWLRVPAGPYERKVPRVSERPEDQPDIGLFSADERQIINRTVTELAEHGGKSVSHWSHEKSAGWRVKKIGQAIPYQEVVIDLTPLDKRELNALRAKVGLPGLDD